MRAPAAAGAARPPRPGAGGARGAGRPVVRLVAGGRGRRRAAPRPGGDQVGMGRGCRHPRTRHDRALADRGVGPARGAGRGPGVPDTLATGPVTVRNVRAVFAARERTGTPARRVALAAHYDTRPWSDQEPDSARRRLPIPGANDGGSGWRCCSRSPSCSRGNRRRSRSSWCSSMPRTRAARPARAVLARSAGLRAPAGRDRHRALSVRHGGRPRPRDPPRVAVAARAASLVELVWEGARKVGARSFRPGVRHTVIDDHVPLLEAGVPAIVSSTSTTRLAHPGRHPRQVSGASLAEVARVAAWIVYESPLARGR